MAHRGRLSDRIANTCTQGVVLKAALVSAIADKLKLPSGVTTRVNKQIKCSQLCLKLTQWSTPIGIERDDIKIIWKFGSSLMPIVVDITRGGGGICSNTRINNNCSVDSGYDFRCGYRNVSHYYWQPSVTTSQEYFYLEDQTTRSKGTILFKLRTV